MLCRILIDKNVLPTTGGFAQADDSTAEQRNVKRNVIEKQNIKAKHYGLVCHRH